MLSRLRSQRVEDAERETAPLVKPTARSPLHEGGRHHIRDERTKTNEGGDAVVASRSCCALRMRTILIAALLLGTIGVAVYRERGMRKGAQTLSVTLQKALIATRSAAQHSTETHAKHDALIKQLQGQNSRLGQKYTEITQKFSIESAARSNNAAQLGDMRAELKRRTNEHEAKLAAHAAQAEKWSAVQAKWDAVNELLATSIAEEDGIAPAADELVADVSRIVDTTTPPPLDGEELAQAIELEQAIAKLPVKARVAEFYRELDPTKDADLLLAGHSGDEAGLIHAIIAEYGAGALAKSDARLVAVDP